MLSFYLNIDTHQESAKYDVNNHVYWFNLNINKLYEIRRQNIVFFSDFDSPGLLCCSNTTQWHGTILFYKYYKQKTGVIMKLSANLSRNADDFAHHLFITLFLTLPWTGSNFTYFRQVEGGGLHIVPSPVKCLKRAFLGSNHLVTQKVGKFWAIKWKKKFFQRVSQKNQNFEKNQIFFDHPKILKNTF